MWSVNFQCNHLLQLSDPVTITRATGAEGNTKGIDALTRISPVAWQHILLNGHYTFQNSNEIIDLDELVAGLKLG